MLRGIGILIMVICLLASLFWIFLWCALLKNWWNLFQPLAWLVAFIVGGLCHVYYADTGSTPENYNGTLDDLKHLREIGGSFQAVFIMLCLSIPILSFGIHNPVAVAILQTATTLVCCGYFLWLKIMIYRERGF